MPHTTLSCEVWEMLTQSRSPHWRGESLGKGRGKSWMSYFVRLMRIYLGWHMRQCWRRQRHPTPVLLPGKSHCWRSLVGCSPWSPEGQTRLSNFTFTFLFHALEKEMGTHSSLLAWRIPGMREPGGLPSMGLQSRTWLKRLSSSSRGKRRMRSLKGTDFCFNEKILKIDCGDGYIVECI